VAGHSPGVATVVAEGQSGILTPAGNADAFTEAVEALLGSPGQRAAMRQMALAKVAEAHGLPAASTRLNRMLSALVA